jgi:hypothetical protein
MITAIVTSLNAEKLLASPSTDINVEKLVGKKARYLDKSDRIWPATVSGIEDGIYLIIKFDNFPSGLGQGQLLDIMEDGDDPKEFELH